MNIGVRTLLEEIVQQVESKERLESSSLIGNIREPSNTQDTMDENGQQTQKETLVDIEQKYNTIPSYTFMDEKTKQELNMNENGDGLQSQEQYAFQVYHKLPILLETKKQEIFKSNMRIYIVPFCFINYRYKYPFLAYFMYKQPLKTLTLKDDKK